MKKKKETECEIIYHATGSEKANRLISASAPPVTGGVFAWEAVEREDAPVEGRTECE
jgi:hypothetical protein